MKRIGLGPTFFYKNKALQEIVILVCPIFRVQSMLCLILAAAALSVVYVRMLGIVAFANSITLCSIIHNSSFIIHHSETGFHTPTIL